MTTPYAGDLIGNAFRQPSNVPYGGPQAHVNSKPLMCRLQSFVRSAPQSRQPLSRVLGYKPLKISAGQKRLLYAVTLGVTCALIATGISDSSAVSDLFRYAISPGTALAVRVIHVEPSHRHQAFFLML